MGYYLHMLFEPGTVPDRNNLLKAFSESGFSDRVGLEKDSGPQGPYAKLKPGREWVHCTLGIIARINDAESLKFPGEWGEFRISWDANQQDFERIVLKLFEIAQKAGFRIYDGQMNCFLDENNFEETKAGMINSGKVISSNLGTVKKNLTVIRNATLQDIDSIHKIEQEVENKNAATKGTLSARLNMFGQGFFVAQEGEEIAGYVESCLWDKKDFKTFAEICDFPQNHNPDGNILYIIFLAVSDSYRKRGIGPDLIRALQKYALNNKIKKMQVVAGKGFLVDFYTKLGFKVTRELPEFVPASFEPYFAGSDGVLMEYIGI